MIEQLDIFCRHIFLLILSNCRIDLINIVCLARAKCNIQWFSWGVITAYDHWVVHRVWSTVMKRNELFKHYNIFLKEKLQKTNSLSITKFS